MTPPIIGLSACIAQRGEAMYHEVKNQYLDAVLTCTNALAVNIPAMADQMDLDAYVARLDGLVLTGSPIQCASLPLWRGARRSRRTL